MRERRPATTDAPVAEYPSIDAFLNTESVPSGRFTVVYEDLPIDFQYEHRDSQTTVVSFHGAAQTNISLPWFVGKGVLQDVEANWLAVSDPTLLLDAELKLSWYAVSQQQPNLQGIVAAVVRHVAQVSGTKHHIFFGSSGGGFASLEMGRRFPGSLALPVNPQTAIRRYGQKVRQHYVDVAWNGETPLVPGSPIVHDLPEVYNQEFPCTVGYIQNSWDAIHISKHLLPFFRTVDDHSSLHLLLGAWGDPAIDKHVPPDKPQLVQIFSALVAAEGDWVPALEQVGFSCDTNPETIRDRAALLNEQASVTAQS